MGPTREICRLDHHAEFEQYKQAYFGHDRTPGAAVGEVLSGRHLRDAINLPAQVGKELFNRDTTDMLDVVFRIWPRSNVTKKINLSVSPPSACRLGNNVDSAKK